VFQLYDHLLQFQLFQGLSRTELLQLAGSTKFGFHTEPTGRTLVSEGDACRQLFFLIKGRLELTTRSADGGYRLTEQLSAPWLLQPEALFGPSPVYSSSCRTLGNCQLITLSKDEVLRLLDDFLIIRLNLLNLLALLAQRRRQLQWRSAPPALRERLGRFLAAPSAHPEAAAHTHDAPGTGAGLQPPERFADAQPAAGRRTAAAAPRPHRRALARATAARVMTAFTGNRHFLEESFFHITNNKKP